MSDRKISALFTAGFIITTFSLGSVTPGLALLPLGILLMGLAYHFFKDQP